VKEIPKEQRHQMTEQMVQIQRRLYKSASWPQKRHAIPLENVKAEPFIASN